MQRKEIQVAVTIIFASVLSVFALSGGGSDRPAEIRQIEDSIRNLRRADNMHIVYSYTVSDGDEIVTLETDVWADYLTDNWVAEYYTTDVDGTRLYLKRFCDGKEIYTHIDWNGEWSQEAAGKNAKIPYLDTITALDYGNEDILDITTVQEKDMLKISYYLTQEYLDSIDEEKLVYLEKYYKNYDLGEAVSGVEDEMYLSLEQYRQMQIKNARIVYCMDADKVLRSGSYSYDVVRPELVTEESGDTKLGEEETIQNLLQFEVRQYNNASVLDKIEQYASEIL